MLFSITISPQTVSAKTNISLTVTDLGLFTDSTYNIDIRNKVKGSTYVWYSSDISVVSVNKKNGIVKAINTGEAVVNCDIKKPDGTIKTLSSEITVYEKPEFFHNKLMAHALGGFEGNKYNNTEEALISSIENGFNFVEVDMTLTSDNKLVCSHGWDKATSESTGVKYTGKAPTYKEFMSWKIQGEYNTIDAETVIDYMREYPNLLLEIDLKKFNAKKTKLMIEQLVDICEGDETILDRILMQFTSEEAYFAIEEVYSFKYYQYFTYKSNVKKELDNIIDFCEKNNIVSVAVNYSVLTDSMISKIKANNLCLLTFTIDDLKIAQTYLDKGVDTICTNYITPSDLDK